MLASFAFAIHSTEQVMLFYQRKGDSKPGGGGRVTMPTQDCGDHWVGPTGRPHACTSLFREMKKKRVDVNLVFF